MPTSALKSHTQEEVRSPQGVTSDPSMVVAPSPAPNLDAEGISGISHDLLFPISAILVISLIEAVLASGLASSNQAPVYLLLRNFTGLLGFFATYYSGRPFFRAALETLRQNRIDHNSAICLAIVIQLGLTLATLVGDQATLLSRGIGSSLILFLLTITTLKYTSAIFLWDAGTGFLGSLRSLVNVTTIIPDPSETTTKLILAEDVRPGDILKLSAGQVIPCDAEVLEGRCDVKERKYTWQSKRKLKLPGSIVFGGSSIERGEVTCRAICQQEDSLVTTFLDASCRLRDKMLPDFKRSHFLQSCLNGGVIFVAGAAIVFLSKNGHSLHSALDAGCSIICLAYLSCLVSLIPALRMKTIDALFAHGLLLRDDKVLDKLIAVETILLDKDSFIFDRSLAFHSMELLDERIDFNGFGSAVLAILSHAQDPVYSDASDYLRAKVSNPLFIEVEDFIEYEGKGLCASIAGSDFSVGSEAFLIERGVQVDAGSILGLENGQHPILIAIQDEVVARFVCSSSRERDLRRMVHQLSDFAVQPSLMSLRDGSKANSPEGVLRMQARSSTPAPLAEDLSELDEAGRRIGIELAYIHPDLDARELAEKASDRPPLGLTVSVRTPKLPEPDDFLTFGLFDSLTWDLTKTDVIVFEGNPDKIVDAVRLAHSLRRVQKFLAPVAIGGAVICLALIALLALLPVQAALLVFAVYFGVYFWVLSVVRDLRNAQA